MSTLPKPLFNGDAVTVSARFPRAPEGVLRLMGHPGEAGASRCQGEVGLGAVRDDEPFMRMAAAVQGHALMQDDGDMTPRPWCWRSITSSLGRSPTSYSSRPVQRATDPRTCPNCSR
ncbi:MAG: hypothetical protein JSR83_20230 [Proteobacteria bacterium]|nr:hypothetical protein [Pseudomonadota bacterium]